MDRSTLELMPYELQILVSFQLSHMVMTTAWCIVLVYKSMVPNLNTEEADAEKLLN